MLLHAEYQYSHVGGVGVCVGVCVCVKLRPSQLQIKKKKAMLTTTEGKFGKQNVFQGDSFIHLRFCLNIAI